MAAAEYNSVQVIAMHGWAGDSRCWRPWIEATGGLGWRWQCGERGYGEIAPRAPVWPEDLPPDALRLVIGHSLGPHLVPPEVLREADAVVMLASFASFVPPDRAGRRARAALDGMAAKLRSENDARKMLREFLVNVAAPQSADLLPPGPSDGELHRGRLRADLERLSAGSGLPEGFPSDARVLIVEAGQDRIVASEARVMLRAELPSADVICLEGAGHAFLQTDVLARVIAWAASLR